MITKFLTERLMRLEEGILKLDCMRLESKNRTDRAERWLATAISRMISTDKAFKEFNKIYDHVKKLDTVYEKATSEHFEVRRSIQSCIAAMFSLSIYPIGMLVTILRRGIGNAHHANDYLVMWRVHLKFLEEELETEKQYFKDCFFALSP